MKKIQNLRVVENAKLTSSYHLIRVTSDDCILPKMEPGQFAQILVEDSQSTYLRRPISINFQDEERNEIWLLIQRVGKGTNKLCDVKVGSNLNIILPLGGYFTIPSDSQQKILLIGGGVGVAPLLFLGKKLKERNIKTNFLLGFRTDKDILLIDEFKKYGNIYITTEDGSFGEKGYVIDHSILKSSFDKVYTCGPKPMMQAVARHCNVASIECEVSLENMMACGFGTCLCCVEKTIKGNVCACTEGPVFNIKDLTWTN